MPILSNDRDAPDEVMKRAAQQDPWVMYLIVRQDTPASRRELLLAAAQATMRCADQLSLDPRFAGAFEAWAQRSFRKVTLRAKAAQWAKLDAEPHGEGLARGQPAVRALPPRLRSECGPLLRSLQVFNPASLPDDEPAAEPPAEPMTFVVNPAASMSTGKEIAQVSHAVLMCAWSAWASDPRYQPAFARWRQHGYPCVFAASDRWAPLMAEADGVVVRDAGLTEVDPGTATVMALPPGHTAV